MGKDNRCVKEKYTFGKVKVRLFSWCKITFKWDEKLTIGIVTKLLVFYELKFFGSPESRSTIFSAVGIIPCVPNQTWVDFTFPIVVLNQTWVKLKKKNKTTVGISCPQSLLYLMKHKHCLSRLLKLGRSYNCYIRWIPS